jgi:hypothetical protein
MRDRDIRVALHEYLKQAHLGEPDTLILDELELSQGNARVDVAVINGSLSGYEIKSERDTLDRLPHQRDAYCQCFDMLTIVLANKHIKKALITIPAWWGILEAILTEGKVRLVWYRRPKKNKIISNDALVRFLWKDEALKILTDLGIIENARGKTRRDLWAILLSSVSEKSLREKVREKLKTRGDWRSGVSPFRCDDSSRSVATSQRYRKNRQWLLSRESQHPQS